MIKQGLEARLEQSLSLTPQLQQAIRLLQLSSLDIQQEVTQMVESNPMLEYCEDSIDSADNSDTQLSDTSTESDGFEADSSLTSLSSSIPDEMPGDANWQDVYHDVSTSSSDRSSSDNLLETLNAAPETLTDHLLWQIDLSNLSATDKLIAKTLIAYINEDGYLDEDVSSIHLMFDEELMIELDEVVAVLHYIQSLDPVGVGARSLGECLTLQIQKQYVDHPLYAKALTLLDKHLDLLQKRDFVSIKRALNIKEDDYVQLIKLLRQLKSCPGEAFSDGVADYIVPDAYIKKNEDGEWMVSMNAAVIPDIQVNDHYASMINKVKESADNKYLKDNLEEAKWFMKSLQHRNNTILDVVTVVVKKQQRFLHYGEVAMQPMILKDVADILGVHESTVSRVTNNKYVHTPKGCFPLKFFFSSHVGTDTGGECASTAIRAMIQSLVKDEDSKKPLSDSKLTNLLQKQGINIARRTVAKYREALSIPSSRDRKSLA